MMAPLIGYDNGTRIQALTMLQMKVTVSEIIERTGYNKSTISRIQKKAKERGYDLSRDTKIYLHYVEDAPRVRKPKKCTLEVEEMVVATISKNSATRELSTQAIANTLAPLVRVGISACSIH